MLVKYFSKDGSEDYWLWNLLNSTQNKSSLSYNSANRNGIWIR